ncbi:hypothetical protein [Bacillus sp. NEB1478]|uniref:hypothetical protein n=1 Tax=Bacillus sp. NEB1478 TaxID=3073816 RepID=UPI002872BFE2|nr:hypothetical protein [Bacillus sp. NEB1478]WNB91142.1 hypothetical protein RGB74_14690 [Bacillus sp. NEB1478]
MTIKRRLLLAAILLISFTTALSFFSRDSDQIETMVQPKNQKVKDVTVFNGENDFWEADFSVAKNAVNQLSLKHKTADGNLPSSLTFTLSTAYDKDGKQKMIGTYTFTFNDFPDKLSLSFDREKLLQPGEKKLLLKITGKDHYQFFNLYLDQ